MPTILQLLQLVELSDTAPFQEVVQGTEVRGILAGHFRYSTHSTFANIPVSVAAATCYTQDLALPLGQSRARDAAQSANLVHVYPDRIVHSQLTLADGPTVYEISPVQAQEWMDQARAGKPFVATGLLES